jgi:hypothetical protein
MEYKTQKRCGNKKDRNRYGESEQKELCSAALVVRCTEIVTPQNAAHAGSSLLK